MTAFALQVGQPLIAPDSQLPTDALFNPATVEAGVVPELNDETTITAVLESIESLQVQLNNHKQAARMHGRIEQSGMTRALALECIEQLPEIEVMPLNHYGTTPNITIGEPTLESLAQWLKDSGKRIAELIRRITEWIKRYTQRAYDILTRFMRQQRNNSALKIMGKMQWPVSLNQQQANDLLRWIDRQPEFAALLKVRTVNTPSQAFMADYMNASGANYTFLAQLISLYDSHPYRAYVSSIQDDQALTQLLNEANGLELGPLLDSMQHILSYMDLDGKDTVKRPTFTFSSDATVLISQLRQYTQRRLNERYGNSLETLITKVQDSMQDQLNVRLDPNRVEKMLTEQTGTRLDQESVYVIAERLGELNQVVTTVGALNDMASRYVQTIAVFDKLVVDIYEQVLARFERSGTEFSAESADDGASAEPGHEQDWTGDRDRAHDAAHAHARHIDNWGVVDAFGSLRRVYEELSRTPRQGMAEAIERVYEADPKSFELSGFEHAVIKDVCERGPLLEQLLRGEQGVADSVASLESYDAEGEHGESAGNEELEHASNAARVLEDEAHAPDEDSIPHTGELLHYAHRLRLELPEIEKRSLRVREALASVDTHATQDGAHLSQAPDRSQAVHEHHAVSQALHRYHSALNTVIHRVASILERAIKTREQSQVSLENLAGRVGVIEEYVSPELIVEDELVLEQYEQTEPSYMTGSTNAEEGAPSDGTGNAESSYLSQTGEPSQESGDSGDHEFRGDFHSSPEAGFKPDQAVTIVPGQMVGDSLPEGEVFAQLPDGESAVVEAALESLQRQVSLLSRLEGGEAMTRELALECMACGAVQMSVEAYDANPTGLSRELAMESIGDSVKKGLTKIWEMLMRAIDWVRKSLVESEEWLDKYFTDRQEREVIAKLKELDGIDFAPMDSSVADDGDGWSLFNTTSDMVRAVVNRHDVKTWADVNETANFVLKDRGIVLEIMEQVKREREDLYSDARVSEDTPISDLAPFVNHLSKRIEAWKDDRYTGRGITKFAPTELKLDTLNIRNWIKFRTSSQGQRLVSETRQHVRALSRTFVGYNWHSKDTSINYKPRDEKSKTADSYVRNALAAFDEINTLIHTMRAGLHSMRSLDRAIIRRGEMARRHGNPDFQPQMESLSSMLALRRTLDAAPGMTREYAMECADFDPMLVNNPSQYGTDPDVLAKELALEALDGRIRDTIASLWQKIRQWFARLMQAISRAAKMARDLSSRRREEQTIKLLGDASNNFHERNFKPLSRKLHAPVIEVLETGRGNKIRALSETFSQLVEMRSELDLLVRIQAGDSSVTSSDISAMEFLVSSLERGQEQAQADLEKQPHLVEIDKEKVFHWARARTQGTLSRELDTLYKDCDDLEIILEKSNRRSRKGEETVSEDQIRLLELAQKALSAISVLTHAATRVIIDSSYMDGVAIKIGRMPKE